MRKFFVLILILLFAGVAQLPVFAQARYVVGVMPVYDSSAESLTENLSNNLTFLLYREMMRTPDIRPVLLSPGGLYDTDATDWNREYGRKAHVDAVLIVRILPTTKINDRKRRLKFEVTILDVASGKASAPKVDDAEEVATSDLFSDMTTSYVSSSYSGFFKGGQNFEKQPLGKAALKFVDWTKVTLAATLPGLVAAPGDSGATLSSPPCPVNFRVRYVTKKSVSKSYSILANDEDETSAIKEGVAAFSIPGGPLTFRLSLTDSPYGVPTQKTYQMSTILDCSSTAHTAVVEIGNAGEAFLHWE